MLAKSIAANVLLLFALLIAIVYYESTIAELQSKLIDASFELKYPPQKTSEFNLPDRFI